MFCPNCSEPKVSDSAQFCTKCGFDLADLSDFINSGGVMLRKSHRQKGIRQGAKFILLGILLIPVWLFIGAAFPANDRLVESSPSTTPFEQIAWILMWVSFLAGAARIAFATVFDHKDESRSDERPHAFKGGSQNSALPDGGAFYPADPGRWKTTDEIFESVKREPKISGELS